jgi:hypothetical protein
MIVTNLVTPKGAAKLELNKAVVAKLFIMIVLNLVTPTALDKCEHLFNKLAS